MERGILIASRLITPEAISTMHPGNEPQFLMEREAGKFSFPYSACNAMLATTQVGLRDSSVNHAARSKTEEIPCHASRSFALPSNGQHQWPRSWRAFPARESPAL